MTNLHIRLATAEDIRSYAGRELPADYCICSALGYAAERDGRVVAISLVTWDSYARAWVWFDTTEPLSPIVMHRRALKTIKVLREVGEPLLLAFCSRRIADAEKWLKRLGFHPAPELTTDPNHPVWRCVP